LPKALISGITGQDGSYLAEFLLNKGYEVIGMVRRSSTINFHRIAHIQDQLTLVQGDLLDQISMIHILEDIRRASARGSLQSCRPIVCANFMVATGVHGRSDSIRSDAIVRCYTHGQSGYPVLSGQFE